jgi:hypothetical protein
MIFMCHAGTIFYGFVAALEGMSWIIPESSMMHETGNRALVSQTGHCCLLPYNLGEHLEAQLIRCSKLFLNE